MREDFEVRRTEQSGAVKKIPCEVYSRVCGYFRPTFTWNKGKQMEYVRRTVYSIESAVPGSSTDNDLHDKSSGRKVG